MNYKNWWNKLSIEWKTAFNEVVFNKGLSTSTPIDAELELLFQIKVLRFAGPKASYPNMKTELKDLSGIKDLTNLETLVVISHHITTLTDLAKLHQLKGLFVFDNAITSLQGLEEMLHLKDLYVQNNKIKSLLPLQNLTKLETIYATNNLIDSLDGISEAHSNTLTKFYILPNEALTNRVIIPFENNCFIKCLKG